MWLLVPPQSVLTGEKKIKLQCKYNLKKKIYIKLWGCETLPSVIKTTMVAPSPTAISTGRGEQNVTTNENTFKNTLLRLMLQSVLGKKIQKKNNAQYIKNVWRQVPSQSVLWARACERVCVCCVMSVITITKVASGSAAISSGREEKNILKQI